MVERIINIGIPDGTSSVDDELRSKVEEVMGVLMAEGVIAESDNITINLQPNRSVAVGSIGRRFEVQHIYRDGKNGPIDPVSETYRID